VAHLIDVAESMRSVEVKPVGRNRATCYRCNNMPNDVMDALPATYERLLEVL
jgi:hypothetical protein